MDKITPEQPIPTVSETQSPMLEQSPDLEPASELALAEPSVSVDTAFREIFDAQDSNGQNLSRAERGKDRAEMLKFTAIGLALGGLALHAVGLAEPDQQTIIAPSTYLHAGVGAMVASNFGELWSNRKIKRFERREQELNKQLRTTLAETIRNKESNV